MIMDLKELFNKYGTGVTPTPEEKQYIREQAEVYDIAITNTRCKSCWSDAIAEILLAEKKANSSEEVTDTHKLREPFATKGIYWGNIYVSQAVMTDELYERMVKAGLGRLFEE